MNRVRRLLRLSLLALTVCAVIFGNSAIQSTVLQPIANECLVTISGAQNAGRIPAQDVWEATFKRIAFSSSGAILSGIDPRKAVRVAHSAANALLRADALRQSLTTAPAAGLPRQASQDRDLVVADSILDARDSELRALSPDEFEQLTDYAMETARTLNVTLPVSGRVASDAEGNRTCELKVKGTDYPHLVLEHHVWGQMFKNLTVLIALSNERFGGIADKQFIQELRMPIEDIRVFVGVANDTAAQEKAMRMALVEGTAKPSAEQYKQLEARVARLVMFGRYTILRTIAPDSWRALTRYVDRVRSNTNSYYSSVLSQ
jgi:hypothetical protein